MNDLSTLPLIHLPTTRPAYRRERFPLLILAPAAPRPSAHPVPPRGHIDHAAAIAAACRAQRLRQQDKTAEAVERQARLAASIGTARRKRTEGRATAAAFATTLLLLALAGLAMASR